MLSTPIPNDMLPFWELRNVVFHSSSLSPLLCSGARARLLVDVVAIFRSKMQTSWYRCVFMFLSPIANIKQKGEGKRERSKFMVLPALRRGWGFWVQRDCEALARAQPRREEKIITMVTGVTLWSDHVASPSSGASWKKIKFAAQKLCVIGRACRLLGGRRVARLNWKCVEAGWSCWVGFDQGGKTPLETSSLTHLLTSFSPFSLVLGKTNLTNSIVRWETQLR